MNNLFKIIFATIISFTSVMAQAAVYNISTYPNQVVSGSWVYDTSTHVYSDISVLEFFGNATGLFPENPLVSIGAQSTTDGIYKKHTTTGRSLIPALHQSESSSYTFEYYIKPVFPNNISTLWTLLSLTSSNTSTCDTVTGVCSTKSAVKRQSFNFQAQYQPSQSSPSAVPLPATAFMFAPALLGFLGFRRKLRA